MWTRSSAETYGIRQLGLASVTVGAHSVDIEVTLAYLAMDTGLGIVDIGNPYSPYLIGVTPTGGEAADAVVDNDIAFVGDRSAGLVILDVSDPFDPVQISSMPTPGTPDDLELAGNTLYVADGPHMLVVDVTDLLNPVITDAVKVNGTAVGVSSNEGLIHLCDRYGYHILAP